jgi:mono/diheme cytochrome c family protein
MKNWFLILLGTFLFSACTIMSANDWNFGNRFTSNGERIYFTTTNEDGQRISYSGGASQGGMMMRAQLICASCHGDDGRGGEHIMHMTLMDAPDIRFSALSGEEDEHNDDHGEEAEHALEHASYDIDVFQRAVIYGEHPNGNPLDIDMPRWQLSDDDLIDLFTYIKSLD